MNFISPKTPWLAKKAFPSYVWELPSKEKVIYLTFDDGPTPVVTEKVLEILATYKAKATFFCIGKNITENQAIYQQILEHSHAVGNHTYNHLKGWKVATTAYIENTLETEQKIENFKSQIPNSNITPSGVKKSRSKLFRPPYGSIKPSQGKALQKLGYKIVMWDVLAIDWDSSVSKEQVLNNIITNTENGSIVVLHDSIKASENMLYALPKVLDYFTKKGFVFKEIELS